MPIAQNGETTFLGERLSCRNVDAEITWATGDATLECISAVSWARYQFLSVCPKTALSAFGHYRRRQFVIAECVLASSAMRTVTRCWLSEIGQMLQTGTDNSNAFYWLYKGKDRNGIALRLMAAILHWCVKYEIDVSPYYLRSGAILLQTLSPEQTSWRPSNGQRPKASYNSPPDMVVVGF